MTTATPQLPPPTDPIGETLHLLRLTGTLYCRSELSAPWGISIPDLPDMLTFMVITEGACWLEFGDQPPLPLQRGSLTLVPQGEAHTLVSKPGEPAEHLFDLPVEKISERYEFMRHGGGGEITRIMYGAVRFDNVSAQRLISMLPGVLQIDAFNDEVDEWIHSTLRLIAREAVDLRPGGETVLTRLADVLIIQAIRAWLDTSPDAQSGWLAALRDPHIGKAMAAIHRSPAEDWTVGSLADRAAMSRSAFAAKFTTLLGEAPMQYLTWWRMQMARNFILDSCGPLTGIGDRFGYKSDAAFSRTFKKTFGIAPGQLRRTQPEMIAPDGTAVPMAV